MLWGEQRAVDRMDWGLASGPPVAAVAEAAVVVTAAAGVSATLAAGVGGSNAISLRVEASDRLSCARLPLLGESDEGANRAYTRQFVLDRDAEVGKRFGLSYAEPYHYIGPAAAKVEEYVRRNAVKGE